MGASTCWLAVRGKPRDTVLEELALRVGDSRSDAHDSRLQGCDFPNGWYVIAAGGYDNPVAEDATLQRLSIGCEVVAGGAETHVMCSTASGWKDGTILWRVQHGSEIGIDDVECEGELPPVFGGIYDALRSQQDAEGEDPAVDYIFDAPLKLCQKLTGYHYDEYQPGEEWHVLVPVAPPKKSLFGRLFGR